MPEAYLLIECPKKGLEFLTLQGQTGQGRVRACHVRPCSPIPLPLGTYHTDGITVGQD
jgi:hypothetical protein